ncbi:KAP family P-loop NTPase fold protein [Clostridium beijerinckii]|uniref:KAP NTPase domain-containing protein n=1 Tax=Clostridium beijerinckii TaxID=1520 RepID=A0AAE5H4Y7_CLOBE|nr:P-loop NTPase fold protein [Clostridium beijerinckii]NSB15177.1 hypothetical protein [Clostridium beijerinckii]OOM21292.1 KAP family P-loop domain protein [Clostridium beijerinckii]
MNDNNSKLEKLIEQRDKLQEELQRLIEDAQGLDYIDCEYEDTYLSSPEYRIDKKSRQIDMLNSQIGEIYYKEEKELYKREYDEKMVNYSKGSLISDLMNTEDLFNRKQRAETLAEYIIDKTTETPFNVGIFARWGEGKTTFLDYLEEELVRLNKKENNENFKTYIVNYDASEYEEKDKIWASIMRAMFLQYEKTTWFPKLFYTLKKILCNIRRFVTYVLSYILSLLIVCVLSASSLAVLWSDWNNKWNILAASGITIMAIIILITKVLLPTVKALLQSAVPLSEKIINNISLPNYVDKLGERENIKKDLSILVEAWLNRRKNNSKRIVLIIDELDRCSEKGIIEFFQSMQLFLKVPQIIIIFAIDQEYLKKALSNSFKITDKKELDEFLLEYLDKYINMPISLDTDVNYLAYIDYLLSNVIKNELYFAISDGEKEVIKSTIETIPIPLLTPRKVKKLVNMLVLSKETCVFINKRNEDVEIIDFRGYALWFLFSYFYQESAKLIIIYGRKYTKYMSVKNLLNKISKDDKNKLLMNIDNEQIINQISEIVLSDIYNYEKILSGFTKIVY